MNVSKIVNRGNKWDCELNSQESISVYNLKQYLQLSYLFMLDKNTRDRNETYSSCCKKAIEHMEKNCGVRIIQNHQILMKWNHTFRLDEVFPHPNNYIQHGYTYHSKFLKTFPETKILISKWANKNLDTLSCKNVGIYI